VGQKEKKTRQARAKGERYLFQIGVTVRHCVIHFAPGFGAQTLHQPLAFTSLPGKILHGRHSSPSLPVSCMQFAQWLPGLNHRSSVAGGCWRYQAEYIPSAPAVSSGNRRLSANLSLQPIPKRER
jgi:hypothetical protein